VTMAVVAFLALGVAVAFTLPTAASAAIVHPYESQITEAGGSALGTPQGLAVDSAGNLYLTDAANQAIDKFDSTGAPLTSWGTNGQLLEANGTPFAPPGEESGLFGLAVDGSDNLWASDLGVGLVDKFDPAGTFLAEGNGEGNWTGRYTRSIAFSVAAERLFLLDSGTGELWALKPDATVESGIANFGTCCFFNVAADNSAGASGGDLYVSGEGNAVSRIHGSGPEAGEPDPFSATAPYIEGAKVTGGPSGPFGTAGTGLGVRGLAVDSAGNLFVGGENGIFEFDSTGAFLGKLTGTPTGPGGSHVPFGEVTAVGVGAASGKLYVADRENAVVDVFGPGLVIPDVETKAPTEVKPHEATLHGTISPDEIALAECAFEWGETESYGHSAECEPNAATIGAGNTTVAVHAEISGLEGGSTYHFRLVASNSNGKNEGADESFETPPPPSIDAAEATEVTATSAKLTAEVNPKGGETTCQIEWGPTREPGNPAVPYEHAEACNPAQLGAGSTDVDVSLQLTTLAKDTTYHWRVLATSASGTTTGVEHTFVFLTEAPGSPPGSCPANEAFRTGPSAQLPDCRAYEMVTPPNKNGAALGNIFIALAPDYSSDGSRLILTSLQCFADAESCNANRGLEGSSFAFTRAGAGWVANSMAGPASRFGVSSIKNLSADTGMSLLSMPTPPFGEDDLYARRVSDGSLTDIGPISSPSLGAKGPGGSSFLATADLSQVVFSVRPAGELGWSFDATQPNGQSLYEYVGAGNEHPFLVGVSGDEPGSTSLISQCGTVLGGESESGSSLSADGRTVYFTTTPCATGTGENAGKEVPAYELYARVNGETADPETLHISQSQCGAGPGVAEVTCRNAPPADAQFEGASTDGSLAYFTSTGQLTDGASGDSDSADSASAQSAGCPQTTGPNGCNLYLYDRALPEGQRLLDVSAGDTSGGGPRVQGRMAVSADGSHVYFVARGVLAANENGNGEEAQAGAENLYAYQRDAAHPGGQTTFVATLSEPFDSQEWAAGVVFANVSPDGRFLIFKSNRALTPDDTREGPQIYDPQAFRPQIYRYDAQSDQLLRVSIGQRGFNDNGNAGTGSARIVPGNRLSSFAGGNARRNPSMSNDGSRVFFTSPIGLTPGALDDVPIQEKESGGIPQYALNIYEWQAPGSAGCSQAQGCVRLISDGRDTGSAPQAACQDSPQNSSTCLLGTDAEGKNVFFTTGDSLVPQDTDTGIDFYDARVGGGFPETAGVTPCQSSEACHQGGTAEGPASSPATPAFNGKEEGPKHAQCKKGYVKKQGKCVKGKSAKKHHAKKHHGKKKSQKRTAGHKSGGGK
jgi:sugar lactone lactonase YvrE